MWWQPLSGVVGLERVGKWKAGIRTEGLRNKDRKINAVVRYQIVQIQPVKITPNQQY
jgi:hypothetical protein